MLYRRGTTVDLSKCTDNTEITFSNTNAAFLAYFTFMWREMCRKLHLNYTTICCENGSMHPLCESYLRDVDASFLERAVVGILGAHVTVLAPVARERAIYAGEAAETERREDTVREGLPAF